MDEEEKTDLTQCEVLQVLCAKKVGTNLQECLQQWGKILSDIPQRLVEEIIPWVSAYDLLHLDTSGLDERGYSVEQLWQSHAERRWLHRKPSQRNPFRIGQTEWRQFYIDEHFKEALNYCSNEYIKYRRLLGEDPMRTLKAPLIDLPKYRYQTPPEGFKDFTNVDDLKELAPFVRTICVSYKQAHYLEQYPDLLHALSHSIETLTLQNLSTRGSLGAIRTLIIYGRRLQYLDVKNCIWDEVMMSMLTMMSGQMTAVEMAKLDADMNEESRKAEKDACNNCSQCQMRKRTYQPYQVPHFMVENSTIHPISDAKFVRILKAWTDLKEFIHICSPLSTPKVEQETIEPLMDALVFLARTKQLTRIHLNGPYHMSVIDLFTRVTSGDVKRIHDITYNTLIYCHVGCQLAGKDGPKRTRSPAKKAIAPGIVSLEINSLHCDAVLRPVIFKPIVEIVTMDENLRHLSMQSCRQFPESLALLFRAITKASRLVSLDITGNYVQRSAFGDLMAMIKKCLTLRTLVIDYCELPTRESYVAELADAIAFSGLTTISVANNRLGEYAAQMVVDVLKRRNGDHTRVHSLNVSQNCIKFDAIESMCDQLVSLRKDIPHNGPLITNLSLDDVLDCDEENLVARLGQLSRLKVVGNVMSRNNLLLASRATMLGFVSQM